VGRLLMFPKGGSTLVRRTSPGALSAQLPGENEHGFGVKTPKRRNGLDAEKRPERLSPRSKGKNEGKKVGAPRIFFWGPATGGGEARRQKGICSGKSIPILYLHKGSGGGPTEFGGGGGGGGWWSV